MALMLPMLFFLRFPVLCFHRKHSAVLFLHSINLWKYNQTKGVFSAQVLETLCTPKEKHFPNKILKNGPNENKWAKSILVCINRKKHEDGVAGVEQTAVSAHLRVEKASFPWLRLDVLWNRSLQTSISSSFASDGRKAGPDLFKTPCFVTCAAVICC